MADPGVPTTWLDDLLGVAVSWLGTLFPKRGLIEFEGSGVESVVDDPVLHRTVVTISGSGGAETTVASWSALLALSTTSLQSGARVFVESLKREFTLDVDSAATPIAYEIGAALGGGQWLMSGQDPFWVQQTPYYIDDTASAENPGTDTASPIPMAEWVRRTSQPWPYAYTPALVIQSDIAFPRFDAGWLSASNQSFPDFSAAPKSKILTNATVTAVTLADPCIVFASVVIAASGKTVTQGSGDFRTQFHVGQLVRFDDSTLNTGNYTVSAVSALVLTFSTATFVDETVTTHVVGIGGREGTVTIAGSWASSVQRLAIVNAGPRAGYLFWILQDKGSGVARTTNVQASPYDSFTLNDLQVGDTFDTWELFKITTDFQQTGAFDEGGTGFEYLHFTGEVNFGDCTVGGCGACLFDHAPSVYSSAQVTFGQCLILGDGTSNNQVELYSGSIVYAFGGGSINCNWGADLATSGGFRNFTLQGGEIFYGPITFSAGSWGIAEGLTVGSSWLAQFDCTGPALVVSQGGLFVTNGNAIHWGQNCDGPRIVVEPGGSYVYAGAKPNFTGSGHDFSLVGVAKDTLDIPTSNVGSDAYIYDLTTGGPNTGGGVSTATAPLVITAGNIAQHVADSSHDGYLDQTDWAAFAAGTALAATSLQGFTVDAPLHDAGTGTHPHIQVHVADGSDNGYLASSDWSSFTAAATAVAAATTVGAANELVKTGGSGEVVSPIFESPAATDLTLNSATGIERHQKNGSDIFVRTMTTGSSNDAWSSFLNIQANGGYQVQCVGSMFFIASSGGTVQCWAPFTRIYTAAGVLSRSFGSAAACTDALAASCTSFEFSYPDAIPRIRTCGTTTTYWEMETVFTTAASATPVFVPGLQMALANNRGYVIEFESNIRSAGNQTGWGGESGTFTVDGSGAVTCQNSGSTPIQDPRSAGDVALSAFVVEYDFSTANLVQIKVTPLAGQTVTGIYTLRVKPGP